MSRRNGFSLAHFEHVALGMQRADPFGLLDVVEKHHGADAMLDLFETDLFGTPLLDEDGVAIWRKGSGDDEPNDEPRRWEVLPLPEGLATAKPMGRTEISINPRRADSRQPPREGTMSTATAAPLKSPATPAARMSLANVERGKKQRPHRIVLYGPEGIGKSTFGAHAPAPIFLPVEDGTDHLDVARFPKPQSWQEVRDAVRVLRAGGHDFKTLIIDTVDALEPLCWRHICETHVIGKNERARSIEDFGYGKGYTMALEAWRGLMLDLEQLGTQGMHVIGLAHAQVKSFKNPAGEDYDRYELKLHAKAAGLWKEWSDSLLFANYETFAKKDDKKRVRGIDTGARLIWTERRAAYDAKHRGNLPESLPLSWADFVAEASKEIDPKQFAAEILRRATELGPDTLKLVQGSVDKAVAAADVGQLIQINNRVNTRLAEKQAQEESN